MCVAEDLEKAYNLLNNDYHKEFSKYREFVMELKKDLNCLKSELDISKYASIIEYEEGK